ERAAPFARGAFPRLVATPDPSATLSSSADFPVLPVIRPTQLPPFPVGTRRASPVAGCVLVAVLSLTTPPGGGSASIGLRYPLLPSPSQLQARPPDLSLSRPPRVHLRYGPAARSHPKEGVVNGLQVSRFPSCLPSQLRSFRFLPRQVYLLLNPSAFPGRTTARESFDLKQLSSDLR